MVNTAIPNLSTHLLAWQKDHGRHDLPWQVPAFQPYRVWVSEIMLQQTQVITVQRYFIAFMSRWPTLAHLANAPEEDVLHAWSGLGYYRRARHLHASAKIMQAKFANSLPQTLQELEALPGIGKSTAGAILSLGYNQPAAILDGNVKRLFTRLHGISTWPGERQTEKMLWTLAHRYLSQTEPGRYNQALMDLGATVCTPRLPACSKCPLTTHCQAFKTNQQNMWPISKPKIKKKDVQIELLVIQAHDTISDTKTAIANKKSRPKPSWPNYLPLNHQNTTLFWMASRPDNGIWAKFWCFPEGNLKVYKSLLQDAEPFIEHTEELPSFKHTLTHLNLTISPLLITLSSPLDLLQYGLTGQWLNIDHLRQKGLPKPVHKILRDLNTATSSL